MPTINSPSDSFLHSPFCFLSSLVTPSSTYTLVSSLSSSEFPYRWERVCVFLVVVVDSWPAGFLGSRKDRRPLAFMPGRALPTSSLSDDSFLANVPLSVEAGSDGPYVSVGSIRPSRIAGKRSVPVSCADACGESYKVATGCIG